MIRMNRRLVLIIIVITLGVIFYLWYSKRATTLYVSNATESTYCFYLDGDFKTVVPPEKTVKLKVKTGKDRLFAVSHTLGGIMLEEFQGNIGGKFVRYNIFGQTKNTKGELTDGKVLRINRDKPGKWIARISLDNLHRMMFGDLNEETESLSIYTPEDAIRMVGDIKYKDAMPLLHGMMGLAEKRVSWPEALRSIGKLDTAESVRILFKYANHAELDVALGAIDGVFYTQNPQTVNNLAKLYRKKSNLNFKRYVLQKIAELPARFKVDLFIKYELPKVDPALLPIMLKMINERKLTNLTKPLEKLLQDKKYEKHPGLKKEIRETIKNLK